MAENECDPVTIRVIEHNGGWHEHQRWDYVIGTILGLLFLLAALLWFNACTDNGSDKPPMVVVPVTNTTVHAPTTTTPPTVVIVPPSTTTPKTLPVTR